MKQRTRIFLALLLTTVFASAAYSSHATNQFGLSDSCWQVFLSQLSGGDSTLGDNLETLNSLTSRIDSMMKLIPGLRGKAVKNLQKQIIALRKQRIALHKQTNRILKANIALLLEVRDSCGQDTPDTTVTDTTDTTGGGGTDSLTIGLNPNPLTVGGSVNLTFTLSTAANVTVNVFNQTTATLVQTFSYPGLTAGAQTLVLNLGVLPPGSYLVQVQAGSLIGTATLLIL